MAVNLHAVGIEIPEGANVVIGQSHFIKTVGDLYEVMITTVPGAQFGLAFNESSGPCLVRSDGREYEPSWRTFPAAFCLGWLGRRA